MTDTHVTHLECSMTGKHYEAGKVHGLSEVGRPLLVRYDLERMKATLDRDRFSADQTPGFWRYAPFLPVTKPENRISLGEVVTPLMAIHHAAHHLGAVPGRVTVKDEGRLPTGSFKARGLCLAVSMATEFGIKHMAIPTNGNAGAALAAYASRAGIKTTVFCPDDTPDINVREIRAQGGDTYLVNGLINDCGAIVGGGKPQPPEGAGWFDVSTLKEPYRIEGKKTMGLELCEQMGWRLPDVIFYPTGGGTGMIGMWKAFAELKALGWLEGPMPRMVAVQATGCAPIIKAWEEGEEHAPLWQDAHTVAAGIRVPIAVGDFLILRAVRESNGFAMAVEDAEIMAMRDAIAADEGMLLCPEGAATAVAYKKALAEGLIDKDDRALLWNCATGLKYPLPKVDARLDRHQPIDYGAF
ncbi:MAG: threonine synthase [Pseudomonadota bacterium]